MMEAHHQSQIQTDAKVFRVSSPIISGPSAKTHQADYGNGKAAFVLCKSVNCVMQSILL